MRGGKGRTRANRVKFMSSGNDDMCERLSISPRAVSRERYGVQPTEFLRCSLCTYSLASRED
jgi:hypothetical protein